MQRARTDAFEQGGHVVQDLAKCGGHQGGDMLVLRCVRLLQRRVRDVVSVCRLRRQLVPPDGLGCLPAEA